MIRTSNAVYSLLPTDLHRLRISRRTILSVALALLCVYGIFVLGFSQGVLPGTRRYLIHEFTDAGIGHKYSELLFSIHEAHRLGLSYCLHEESFLFNSRRHDDYSFMLPVIYAAFPKCHTIRGPKKHTYYSNNCPDSDFDNDCFYSPTRFFNDVDMFRLDTKRAKEDALGVHLRFGDTEANGNVEFYTKNIGHIQGLTGVQKVRFCYHSKDDQEMLLVKLKEVFPEAEFVNSGPIMETMACLTEGRMMVTSGSSLSYMFAHLCKECVVFFTQPKELMPVNTLYKEEVDIRRSIYYVDRYITLPPPPLPPKNLTA